MQQRVAVDATSAGRGIFLARGSGAPHRPRSLPPQDGASPEALGTLCPDGKQGIFVGTAVKVCALCPAGTYGDGIGCSPCDAGTAAPLVGSSACGADCDAGTYSEDGGSVASCHLGTPVGMNVRRALPPASAAACEHAWSPPPPPTPLHNALTGSRTAAVLYRAALQGSPPACPARSARTAMERPTRPAPCGE